MNTNLARTDTFQPLWLNLNKYFEQLQEYFFCLILASLAFLLYMPILQHPLAGVDDGRYVGHVRVAEGITWDNFWWSFQSLEVVNWHPMTWLSYLIDTSIWGTHPSGYYLSNLLLFSMCAAALMLVYFKYFGNRVFAALCTLAYIVNPLRVESVAWLSQRKDLLSLLFLLLMLICWHKYIFSKKRVFYIAASCLFVLGLMSKPTLVAVPFALVLLDHYPFNRLIPDRHSDLSKKAKTVLSRIAEKWPFFLSAIATAVVTLYAQETARQEPIGLVPKISGIFVAYARYVTQSILPVEQVAFFYGGPEMWPVWQILTSMLFVMSISIISIVCLRKLPWLTAGWLWFIGTLIPTVGIIQVGAQTLADRYTLIPHLAFIPLLIFSLHKLFYMPWRFGFPQFLIYVSLVSFWSLKSMSVISEWAKPTALLEKSLHSCEIPVNQIGLGNRYLRESRLACAAYWYRKAMQAPQTSGLAHAFMGNVQFELGRPELGLELLRIAHKLEPQEKVIQYDFALALMKNDKLGDALGILNEILHEDPESHSALLLKSTILFSEKEYLQAQQLAMRALRRDPRSLVHAMQVVWFETLMPTSYRTLSREDLQSILLDFDRVESFQKELAVPLKSWLAGRVGELAVHPLISEACAQGGDQVPNFLILHKHWRNLQRHESSFHPLPGNAD